MTDIVERLRENPIAHAEAAAREIERLRALLHELPAYQGALNSLHTLLHDLDSGLALHAHKRAAVKRWIQQHIDTTAAEHQAAKAAIDAAKERNDG
jgi:hypothetical protein